MADKDEEFLDGDDAGGGEAGAVKEGGKAKASFRSGLILQILKWVAIVIGLIVFIVTVVVVVINIMGVTNNKNSQITESPEYDTRPVEYQYFAEMDEFRGETVAGTDNGRKHLYIVKVNLGFAKDDKDILNEIISRKIQIQDRLLAWFSSQDADYLGDVQNRDEIREQVRQVINQIVVKPILDIRFTKFEILGE
jgi:flagellar FliL protein